MHARAAGIYRTIHPEIYHYRGYYRGYGSTGPRQRDSGFGRTNAPPGCLHARPAPPIAFQ